MLRKAVAIDRSSRRVAGIEVLAASADDHDGLLGVIVSRAHAASDLERGQSRLLKMPGVARGFEVPSAGARGGMNDASRDREKDPKPLNRSPILRRR